MRGPDLGVARLARELERTEYMIIAALGERDAARTAAVAEMLRERAQVIRGLWDAAEAATRGLPGYVAPLQRARAKYLRLVQGLEAAAKAADPATRQAQLRALRPLFKEQRARRLRALAESRQPTTVSYPPWGEPDESEVRP